MTNLAIVAFAAFAAAFLPAAASAEVARPGFSWGDAYYDPARRVDGFQSMDSFQPVVHEFDMRFGMAYSSDRGAEPVYGARYRVTFNHRLDNGFRVGLSVGISTDNMNTSARWRDRALARN